MNKSSKELGPQAIYDDWKRKAIDDAKKRAVAQVDYIEYYRLMMPEVASLSLPEER